MGWRNSIVFKPLIGEQTFIDNFYSDNNPFRSENDSNKFYLFEYKGDLEDMCHTVTKEYPGITFIGYSIYDNTCGEYCFNQIMFNKRDGVIFYGPDYVREPGRDALLFDKNNNCIIRGLQNGTEYYNVGTEEYEKVEPGSIWKSTNTETSGYSKSRPEERYSINVTKEIDKLVDCIIEEYRMKIGITDKEYNLIKEKGLQYGYLLNGTIIQGSYKTEVYSPNILCLSRFHMTMILKKTISDLDWLMIKKLRETDDIDEIKEYAKTIDVNEIWKEHENRFREGKGSIWEKTEYEDEPF